MRRGRNDSGRLEIWSQSGDLIPIHTASLTCARGWPKWHTRHTLLHRDIDGVRVRYSTVLSEVRYICPES